MPQDPDRPQRLVGRSPAEKLSSALPVILAAAIIGAAFTDRCEKSDLFVVITQ